MKVNVNESSRLCKGRELHRALKTHEMQDKLQRPLHGAHGFSRKEPAWGFGVRIAEEWAWGIWYLFPQPESCSGLCKAKTMSVECLENIGSLIFTKHVSNRRFLSISSWTWFLRLSPKGQSNAASLPFCTCSRTSEFQDTNCGSFWAVRLWDNFCSSF